MADLVGVNDVSFCVLFVLIFIYFWSVFSLFESAVNSHPLSNYCKITNAFYLVYFVIMSLTVDITTKMHHKVSMDHKY